MNAAPENHPVWRDAGSCFVLGMGHALPGEPLSTVELIQHMHDRFGIDVKRSGAIASRRLGIETRYICRNLIQRHESPRAGHSNAELAAKALQSALQSAGLKSSELGYVIAHTATPGNSLPPNITRVAELINYDGPLMELRQACTGFANSLVIARGMLAAANGKPIAIVGSETGSVYFDPCRAAQDHGQLVNLLQMGDGAAACIVASNSPSFESQASQATLSNFYFGQIGRDKPSGFSLALGGSDHTDNRELASEFAHDFSAVRSHGPALFTQGIEAARSMGIHLDEVDYIIPHQANGRMAELLAPHIGVAPEKIFVNAKRLGNTGSAAIWLALAELRQHLRRGERVLVLGAEATKHMFGGMVYTHA